MLVQIIIVYAFSKYIFLKNPQIKNIQIMYYYFKVAHSSIINFSQIPFFLFTLLIVYFKLRELLLTAVVSILWS